MASEVEALKNELFITQQELAAQTRKSNELSATLTETQVIAEEAADRLARAEAEVKELRAYKLRCDSLEGTVEALQQEANKLKSARGVLDADIRGARAASEAQARQIAQLQGAAALAKAKADEQAGQLRMLKQQLLDMEEEVANAEADARAARDGQAPAQHHVQASNSEPQQAELADLRQRNSTLTTEVTSLQSQLTEQRRQLEALSRRASSDREAGPPQPAKPPPSAAGSIDSNALTADTLHDMSPEEQRDLLQRCLRLQEQYKRSRDVLLQELDAQSTELERLQSACQRSHNERHVLSTSLQDAEKVSESWQAQAQAALARADQLTELLAEGAQWLASPRMRAQSHVDEAQHDTRLNHAELAREVSAPPAQARDEAVHSADDPRTTGQQDGSRSVDARQSAAIDMPPGDARVHAVDASVTVRNAHCQHCMDKDAEVAKHVARCSELDVQLRALQMEALRATQMSAQVGRAVLPALYSIEARLVESA